jgi:sterol desaturase/sphingolipid hydroxylase (fatty acid hydroxylase superfamily)
MSARALAHASRFAILPGLFAVFVAIRVLTRDGAIDRWVPEWWTFLILFTLMIVERLYTYRYRVSQRPLLARDITSTLVNVFVTGTVTGMIVYPVLILIPEHLWGRRLVFASPGQLGPFWLQLALILLGVSFFRYWMHRFQHKNEFLWKLHSYHHMVSDLQARNTFVSNPIDFALRNVLIFVILGIIGFDPLALLIANPAVQVYGIFSHCGGDVKGGWLNYLFVTPEVHRWHHSAVVPEGHRYSVNYGVEFAIWDVAFGTWYLPQKDGQRQAPERLGHPSGMGDERNYLRLLLVPLGLYGIFPWAWRKLTGGPENPRPAA